MRKLVMLLMGLIMFCAQSFAQSRTVTGKVMDANGTPIPNATVLIKGSNTGTSTNADGVFTINVPANARFLVISSIGLRTEDVAIPSTNTLSVTLVQADKIMDEVVVTGVGAATSRKKVAIAVESVTSKDLMKVPQATIDQALVGKIAGAQILSTSGQPGQQANIILRGINTLGSSQPMILIDGVQVNAFGNANGSGTNVSSRLSDIDLSIIDRVEVIQGSAAATIYGAQGANGVIQLFTKKGARDGKLRVTYNTRVAVDNVLRGNLATATRHYYVTDADGFIVDDANRRLAPNRRTGVYERPQQPASLANAVNNKPYREQTFDNISEVFINNAMTFNNSLNISGGSGKSDYSLTASTMRQESIIFGDLKRHNLTANIGTELFKNFTVRSITQAIYSDNTTGGITGQNNVNSPLGTAINQRPYIDINRLDSVGNPVPIFTDGETSVNPFYTQRFRTYKARTTRIIQNTQLNYKPFPFLELDYKFGLDNTNYNFRDFISNQSLLSRPTNGIGPLDGSVSYNINNFTYKNSLLSAFLRLNFEDDLNIKLPIQSTTHLAYDYRRSNSFTNNQSGTGFAPFPPYSLNTAQTPANSENTTVFVTYGYLINQKFDYGDLFGVSVGFRSDYSSAFGRGSTPFTFPRFDGYLRLTELFKLKDDKIAEAKIRAAFGRAGIQPGAYSRQLVLASGTYGNRGFLAFPFTSANPDLAVEVSSEFEVGTDVSLRLGKESFRNVRLNATYWDRTSEGNIINTSQAPSSGVGAVTNNTVSLASKGFQFSFDADILNKKNITWDFGIRFGTSQTNVTETFLGLDVPIGGSGAGEFVIRQGVSLGTFYGVRPLTSIDQTDSKGVRYISEANAGNYVIADGKVVNRTSRGVFFTTEKEDLGDPNPVFNMTFLNNITLFNKFSVVMQLDWIYGNDIYNQTRQWMYRDNIHSDYDVPVTIDGQTAEFVGFYNSLYNTNNTNSHFVERGSFLRMRELTFNYNLNNLVKRTKFVTSADLSLSGRNLFTITNYSGMDPEAAASFNDPLRRGLDLYAFPNFRTYQLSLTLGF